MRQMLTFLTMLGLFIAGTLFAVQQAIAVMLLAVCMVFAGLLYASAETHGFEGEYVTVPHPPYTWHQLYLDVLRRNVARNTLAGDEVIYVQTPQGPRPLTGMFWARVNHVMSIVLDASEPVAPDAHDFNRAKQGVM